jgi:hypothetical protein
MKNITIKELEQLLDYKLDPIINLKDIVVRTNDIKINLESIGGRLGNLNDKLDKMLIKLS